MNKWIVAAACSFINFLVLGIARLVPVLFVESMLRYNVDRAGASLPYVLCYILRQISGPIVGLAGKEFGYGALTLFGCIVSSIGVGCCFFAEDILIVTILWGCVYGLGFGFGSTLLPAVLDKHFDAKNITKANGISIAGSSLAGIVLPPLFTATIREYGLSGSFLMACGFLLQGIPASLLISMANETIITQKPLKGQGERQDESNACQKESYLLKDSSTELDCIEKPETSPPEVTKKVSTLKTLMIFLDPTFLLIMITQSSYGFACMLVWTILLDFVKDVGVNPDLEVYCVILLPLTDLFGRLSLGWILDGGYVSTTQFCVTSFVLLGVATFLFVLVYNLVTAILVIVLFGFISGGLIPVFPIAVFEFVIPQYTVMALTSRMTFMVPLSFIASPIIGYFREGGGSYDGIFHVCGGISIFCGVLCALIPRLSLRSRAKFERRNEIKHYDVSCKDCCDSEDSARKAMI